MARTARKNFRRPPINPSDVVLVVKVRPEDFPPLPSSSVPQMTVNKGVAGGDSPSPAKTAEAPAMATSHVNTPSYASMAKINRITTHGIKLETMTVNEEKITMMDADCLKVEETWGYALIGYVGGRFPGIKAIRDIMVKWKVQTKLHLHPSGWLIFKFINGEDRARVANGGPYLVFNRPLLLKEMPKEFAFGDEEIIKVPIWIQLPSLPIDYFTKEALSKIASKIGTPLTTDLLTQNREHVAYARILVEIDVSRDRSELPKYIPIITTKGTELNQKVDYEYIPY